MPAASRPGERTRCQQRASLIQSPGLDRTDEALDARQVVAQASARLSAAHREVLALRFAADLTCNEIAQVLGITKTAATTRLSRAMKAFEKASRQGGTR